MNKRQKVINSVRKHNRYGFGEIQSVGFKVVKVVDGYKFLNGSDVMLLPSNSFANVRRKGYSHDKKSLKLVMDMFISAESSGIVGLSEYYGDIGDILCEYGVIYTKSNEILVAVIQNNNSQKKIVINKYYSDNEVCGCMIKCAFESYSIIYDIAVCDISEYIIVR